MARRSVVVKCDSPEELGRVLKFLSDKRGYDGFNNYDISFVVEAQLKVRGLLDASAEIECFYVRVKQSLIDDKAVSMAIQSIKNGSTK